MINIFQRCPPLFLPPLDCWALLFCYCWLYSCGVSIYLYSSRKYWCTWYFSLEVYVPARPTLLFSTSAQIGSSGLLVSGNTLIISSSTKVILPYNHLSWPPLTYLISTLSFILNLWLKKWSSESYPFSSIKLWSVFCSDSYISFQSLSRRFLV